MMTSLSNKIQIDLVIFGMLLGSVCVHIPFANAQQTAFTATYGGAKDDYAAVVQPLTTQGYLVAGWTNSFGAGETDLWLARLDNAGQPLWQKTVGGSQTDYASAILQTSDTRFVTAGGTTSFGSGGLDAWVMEVSTAGDEIFWQKTYGGSQDDYAEAILSATDGGWLVAGWTESFGKGDRDIWLFKLDQAGNLIWQKTYGGSDFDSLSAIQSLPQGGYIITGETRSSSSGTSDFLVLKLNSSGEIVWQIAYNTLYSVWETTVNGTDIPHAIQATDDGGYLVVGEFSGRYPASETQNILILKLQSSGVLLWQKAYAEEHLLQNAYAICPTSDGGFLLGGWSDALLLSKFDQNGEILWQYAYNGEMYEYLSSLNLSTDGGYILGGVTNSFGALEEEMLILKLDQACTPGECALRQPAGLQPLSVNITVLLSNLSTQSSTALVATSTAELNLTTMTPNYVCPIILECAVGDLDCNGQFNILDMQRLFNCIFGNGSCEHGDLNGDGSYNIFDVQQLINKIFS